MIAPHREVRLGEDPAYFERPLVEYLDVSNDDLLRQLHAGEIPRAWRSYLVGIWPRTAITTMRFDLGRLCGAAIQPLRQNEQALIAAVTYIGKDLNRHGGDWEELQRSAMPTRMRANGITVHDFLDPPEVTATHEFSIPVEAITDSEVRANRVITVMLRARTLSV